MQQIVRQLLTQQALIDSGEPFQIVISRHPSELKITVSRFETIKL